MKNKEKIPSLSLADMAYKIANEPGIKEDGSPLDITKAEKILREWAVSDNPVLQAKFMELAMQKQDDVNNEEVRQQKGLSKESYRFIRICMGIEDYPGQFEQLKALEPEKVKDLVSGMQESLFGRVVIDP